MMLALLLIAAVGGHIPEPDLLATGKLISSTDGWDGSVLNQATYEWIAPNEVLYFPIADGRLASIRKLNTSTRRSEVLGPLSKAFFADKPRVVSLAPSPDGKMFKSVRVSAPPRYFVTRIDGHEIGSWPIRRAGGFHDRFDGTKFTTTKWTADSGGFVESVFDRTEAGLVVRAWFRDLRSLGHPVELGAMTLHDDWIYEASPDYSDINRSIKVALDPSIERHEHARLLEWPNDGTRAESRTAVSFAGQDIKGWEFSPDGKRILWMTSDLGSWVYEPKDSPKRPKGPHYVRLWLTNSDGWGMRLLGRVRLRKGEEYEDWHTFGGPRFVPGGEAASFVFRNGLYVVPL